MRLFDSKNIAESTKAGLSSRHTETAGDAVSVWGGAARKFFRRRRFGMRGSWLLLCLAALAFGGGLFIAAVPSGPSGSFIAAVRTTLPEIIYRRPTTEVLRPADPPLIATMSGAAPNERKRGRVPVQGEPKTLSEPAIKAETVQSRWDSGPERVNGDIGQHPFQLELGGDSSLYTMFVTGQSAAIQGAGEPIESAFAGMEMAVIPEPSTAVIVACGLAFLIVGGQVKGAYRRNDSPVLPRLRMKSWLLFSLRTNVCLFRSRFRHERAGIST
ncbi:MAG TPA: hypothetical protein VK993_16720 [Chthoniobacterales bacterium]|nr:hypothetical protein [Chthoniobacterales bacterium]